MKRAKARRVTRGAVTWYQRVGGGGWTREVVPVLLTLTRSGRARLPWVRVAIPEAGLDVWGVSVEWAAPC